jgi:hypothetical protein
MECYRRAMISEQASEGCKEDLNQANKLSRTHATLLDALNRHRGKGQQKVRVEHVHVHDGGQAIVGYVEGVGYKLNRRSNPMHLDLHLAKRCGAHGAGSRAGRHRWQTVDAECTEGLRRAHRRAIGTLSSTAAILWRLFDKNERFRPSYPHKNARVLSQRFSS